MASVVQRGKVWYVKFKDGSGRWQRIATRAQTKTEARRVGEDLERKAERQRHGLEALPSRAAPMAFEELLTWWKREYGVHLRSTIIVEIAERHLLPGLGRLALPEVTSAKVEGILNAKVGDLAPKSLNHLRAFVHRLFALAKRRGLFAGENPAEAVERRRVPKRLPVYLRLSEVPRLLAMLDPRWRPLFATAVYTGMRKGELLGLRKADVDVPGGTLTVARSYDHATTKGGHEDLLPVADGLRPYLKAAFDSSPSDLVFPKPDGSMHSDELALDRVLRRALGRAGVVTGYLHKCRRKGCGFQDKQPDVTCGHCPKCGMRLWAKALPRPLRFHDLRHTTATLLLKDGVPLATVQRILRHTDPRVTSEVYGHLDVEDMRAGVNRLAFGPAMVRPPAEGPVHGPFGPPVVQGAGSGKKKGRSPVENPKEAAAFAWSGRQDSNLRPPGPEPIAGAAHTDASVATGSHPLETTEVDPAPGVDAVARNRPGSTPFGPPVVQGNGERIVLPDELLSVGELARRLGVSRATVYALVARGELPHVRILNVIRVEPAALAAFVTRQRQVGDPG